MCACVVRVLCVCCARARLFLTPHLAASINSLVSIDRSKKWQKQLVHHINSLEVCTMRQFEAETDLKLLEPKTHVGKTCKKTDTASYDDRREFQEGRFENRKGVDEVSALGTLLSKGREFVLVTCFSRVCSRFGVHGSWRDWRR